METADVTRRFWASMTGIIHRYSIFGGMSCKQQYQLPPIVQITLSLSEWRFVEKQSGTNKDWGKFKTLTVTTSINEIVQEKKNRKGDKRKSNEVPQPEIKPQEELWLLRSIWKTSKYCLRLRNISQITKFDREILYSAILNHAILIRLKLIENKPAEVRVVGWVGRRRLNGPQVPLRWNVGIHIQPTWTMWQWSSGGTTTKLNSPLFHMYYIWVRDKSELDDKL